MSDEQKIEYYEELLAFLDDYIPCLDDLIVLFNEQRGDDE